jgi:hypothetical protein
MILHMLKSFELIRTQEGDMTMAKAAVKATIKKAPAKKAAVKAVKKAPAKKAAAKKTVAKKKAA